MTRQLNNDNGLQEQTTRTTGYNTGLAKVAVQCSADTFVVNQNLVLRMNICGENRHLRQARNRYRKPYDDSANIKQTYMKRTILDILANRLTARPTSQRNEVLFFADPHFLFFNFRATTHLAHLVLPATQPDPSQNQKSQIFPRFTKTITFDN